jgi:prepilin-type N-terminal cleavage/methylation domain-containing protein
MPYRTACNGRQRGFSLPEVLLLVVILLVLGAIAVPNIVTVTANSRMRASMTTLSGMLQNTRTLAVMHNQTMSTHFNPLSYGLVLYAKEATDTSPVASDDPQVHLQEPITKLPTPSGLGAPPALDPAILLFTPEAGDPSFNSRGMPCVYSGGVCTNKGFAFYFHDTRPGGKKGWAAITVSPAGRVQRWFWSGSAWGD